MPGYKNLRLSLAESQAKEKTTFGPRQLASVVSILAICFMGVTECPTAKYLDRFAKAAICHNEFTDPKVLQQAGMP